MPTNGETPADRALPAKIVVEIILKKLLLFLLLAAAAGLIGWGILRKNAPPTVGFAHVHSETLISNLNTNGKVEPFEWRGAQAANKGMAGGGYAGEGASARGRADRFTPA